MIAPPSSRPAADERFNVMMTMFAFGSPARAQDRSILCRVLDGRGLDYVCPLDESILTPEEKARYMALQGVEQRAMAFRTRAELRRMLGREIGLPAAQVPLQRGAHGKPVCTHPCADGLAFNVSHTHRCALIALGEVTGIGVDVELIVDEEPGPELLEVVFNEHELHLWSSVPVSARRRAFTDAWTVKEATLKALGTGIDGPPHEINVRFDSEWRAVPVFKDPHWIFERVEFCSCYSACCVVIL